MSKLFLVQVKSDSLIREEKQALLIPMSMEKEDIKGVKPKNIHDALIRDAIKLYPQYTNVEDRPSFSISVMTKKEYNEWIKTNVYKQKSFVREVK